MLFDRKSDVIFQGISVTGPYEIPEHKAYIWIGVLSKNGNFLDAAFVGLPNPWCGSLEETCQYISNFINSYYEDSFKGMLVTGHEKKFNSRCSVVTGEVLEDCVVKMDMYELIKFYKGI